MKYLILAAVIAVSGCASSQFNNRYTIDSFSTVNTDIADRRPSIGQRTPW